MSTQDKLAEALRVFNKVFYKELADIAKMPSDDMEYIARGPVMACIVRLRAAIDKLHATRADEAAQAQAQSGEWPTDADIERAMIAFARVPVESNEDGEKEIMRAALLAAAPQPQPAETVAHGTFCCPVCTHDHPHTHNLQHKWIGVDFDNTLAYDASNRNDPYTLGEPIPAMVNRVRDWLAKGYWVKLFTARMNKHSHTQTSPRDTEKMRLILEQWCTRHLGRVLECTCEKDGFMEVLWDDRAVRVIRDTGNYTHPQPAKDAKTIKFVIERMNAMRWGGFDNVPLSVVVDWAAALSIAIGEVPFDGIAAMAKESGNGR